MDALKDINPETKISDLTVGQFEAVMTRTFCRVADYAAVRFAQEQTYIDNIQVPNQLQEQLLVDRTEGVKMVREMITGDNWPGFKTVRPKPKTALTVED